MKLLLPPVVSLAAMLALCAGCGGSTSADQPAATPQDAGLDANPEAGVEDGAPDAGGEDGKAPDSSPEAGPEASPEAAADASASCVADFTAELTPVIDGLLYLSESDYPFEIVSYADAGTGEITPAHLLELLQLPADTVVEQRTADQFFSEYLLTGPDGAKYQQMRQLLEEHLTELTVIRVGTIEIDVYVVGRTKCGEIAGLKTVAIET